MDDFDSPWKEALDLYFEAFVALCFPAMHREIDWRRPYVTLDKELQKVTPDAEQGRALSISWSKSGGSTARRNGS